MNVNIVLSFSEEMFDKLRRTAERLKLPSIEALIEHWAEQDEKKRREETFAKIEALQKQLSAEYGMMPDSAELVREDRER
jgi:diketogulonate reductase-like aldo/keto reductase